MAKNKIELRLQHKNQSANAAWELTGEFVDGLRNARTYILHRMQNFGMLQQVVHMTTTPFKGLGNTLLLTLPLL